MSEMFNRNAIGVRAHADGVGVKQANVSFETVRGIAAGDFRHYLLAASALRSLSQPKRMAGSSLSSPSVA